MQSRPAPSSPCPDPGVLDAFVSGQISVDERRALELHLDACAPCSSVVAELARLYGSSVPPTTASQLPTLASARSAPPPSTIKTAPLLATVGRYRLLERLGEGGMGVVYVAHDPELDRKVALKLLRPEPSAATVERRARLVLEAQAMAKLAHPNVVTVHDVGRVGDQLFIAMELVDGVTLGRWLEKVRPLRRAVIEVMVAAGRGLAAAHRAGLVHRDFKPDNVLVGRDGRVRVTDFGLARASGPVTLGDDLLDPTGPTRPLAMTSTGMLIGTPAYMAPEQWRGEPADARSDQFAFGVTLYEALFHVRPFAGTTVRELAASVLAGRMQPFPPAPRWLRVLLERALASRPEGRFPTMEALLHELGRDRDRPKRIALSAGAIVAGAAALVTISHFATRGVGPAGPNLDPETVEPEPSSNAGAIPPRCEEARREALAVWGEDRRAHLQAITPITAKDPSRRLGERLDAASKALGEAAALACVRRDDPLEVARKTCLSERRRAIEAVAVVLDTLDYPGPQPYDTLLMATLDFPRPELCGADSYLRARGAAYVAGGQAHTDIELDDAARLRVLSKLNRWADIEPIEKRLLEHATATSLKIEAPATVGEMLLAVGTYREGRRHADEAIAALEEAVLQARTAKDAELEGRAAAALARVHVRETFDFDQAERWLSVAESRTSAPSELARAAAEVADARGELELVRLELVKSRAAFERAAKLRAEAMGDDHPETAWARARLVPVLVALGEHQAAVDAAQPGMNLIDRVLGDKSSRSAWQKRAWAEALIGAGRAADAVEALEGARDIQRDLSPIFSTDSAITYDLLTRADLAQSDFDGAETRAVLGEKQRENAPRREERELAISRGVLAEVLRARGDAKGAVAKRREAVDLLIEQLGPEDVRVAIARLALAQDLTRTGDDAGAMKQLDTGGARVREVLGKDSAHFALFRLERGRILRGRGKHKDALKLFEDGWWVLNRAWSDDHPAIGPLLGDRAEAYEATGDNETAKRIGRLALAQCEKQLGNEHPATKRARKLIERLGP